MKGKCIILFFILLLCKHSVIGEVDTSKYILKLNLADINFASQASIGIGGEVILDTSRLFGLELGAGYIFYTADEDERASGIVLEPKFNIYTFQRKRKVHFAFSVGLCYSNMKTQTYLLTEQTKKGLDFFEYQRRELKKERISINTSLKVEIKLYKNLILEQNMGIGATKYTTVAPPDVIQKDFRNGILLGDGIGPNLVYNFKLGYRF